MKTQQYENTLVRMENLSAAEYIMENGHAPRRALQYIWLRIQAGQVWGIYAYKPYETGLLLEIMANVRPYEAGRCVLAERGMMRKKRVILPHVFYIGNTDMLYESMNVLEYLMFATAKQKIKHAARQEQLFEWLITCGLGGMSLTQIRWLDEPERAVVILMSAAYSKSSIVIVNLPDIEFNVNLRHAIEIISNRMREQGKTLVLNAADGDIIQQVCTHTAVLANGRVIFQGTVDYFREHFDQYTARIEIGNKAEEGLRKIFMDWEITRKGNELFINAKRGRTAHDIIRAVLNSGYEPTATAVHNKTVTNALETLARRHDLS